jgi:soluble lytic murein transglycosylase-like protein
MSRVHPLAARLASAILAVIFVASSRAAIWGYVDAQGETHVATEKLDDRYQLFFKGRSTAEMADEPAPDAKEAAAFKHSPMYLRFVDDPEVERLEPLIVEQARAQGIDAALVKAVIAVESAFRADAVSAKGAVGLMQVVPDTAARYGVVADRRGSVVEKLLDPATNLRVGTRYLRDLLALFANDIALALAAYNAGEQAVQRYDNAIPPFLETREYVKLVQQFYDVYRPALPAAAAKPKRIAVPSRKDMP